MVHASSQAADTVNAILEAALDRLATFDPEMWTETGVAGFEERVIDVAPDRARRYRAALAPVLARIVLQSDVAPPDDAADLQLLDAGLRNCVLRNDLESCVAPRVDVMTLVTDGVSQLLDRGTVSARRAALARLRAYAGEEKGPSVFATLATSVRAALRDPELLLHSRGWIEGELAAAPEHVEALRARVESARSRDVAEALESVLAQYGRYAAVLERAAESAPLTQPVEVELLEQEERELGIEGRSDELTTRARSSFEALQRSLRDEAGAYARARGRGGEPVAETLAAVRSRLIPAGAEESAYRRALEGVRAIVAEQLGARTPRLAIAVHAPAAADLEFSGSPHLAAVHRRTAVLVVPRAEHDVAPEFRCLAAAWVFSAREGFPGRALRNAAVRSRVRALFGSPAAGEGWTCYAERFVRPRLPAEARLLSLQMELLRTARVFTADALLRGTSCESLERFFVEQVWVSPTFAASEVDSERRAPAAAALAYLGLQGWITVESRAARRGRAPAELLERALPGALLPPDLALATLFPRPAR